MDQQAWINVLLLVVSGLGSVILTIVGFLLAHMWRQLDSITRSLTALSVLVAGQYITRSEFDTVMREISNKLDKMSERQHDTK